MVVDFVKKHEDVSDDNGFQFKFLCDICGDAYQSTYKRAPLRKAKTIFGAAERLTGGLGGLAGRIGGLRGAEAEAKSAVSDTQSAVGGAKGAVDTVQSDEMREAKDKALNEAIAEARPHFARCPSCAKYVDARCWNQQALKCIECAPRQAVVVEKAKAQEVTETKEVTTAKEPSAETTAAEEATIICSNCGKPTPKGKFCENCGAPLDKKLCPKCGTKNSATARFCNNCGNKLL